MTLPLNRNKVSYAPLTGPTKTILHLFDGEQLSINQIKQRVPALSTDSIRDYLARGLHTKVAMLTFRPMRKRNGRGKNFQINGKSNG